MTNLMTKRPNLDEYDQEVICFEKEVVGISNFNGEPTFKTTELELDDIQKDFQNSEVLIAIREQQS